MNRPMNRFYDDLIGGARGGARAALPGYAQFAGNQYAQFGADVVADAQAAALLANGYSYGGGCPTPNFAPQMALMAMNPNICAIAQQQRCGPTRTRRELLGFPRTIIAAGDSDTITTQPQVFSKVVRITIPSDIAFQLLLLDFKIGKWSLMANGDPVPAAMLDELATDVEIDPDASPVNTTISATLENTSNADVDVRMGALVDACE